MDGSLRIARGAARRIVLPLCRTLEHSSTHSRNRSSREVTTTGLPPPAPPSALAIRSFDRPVHQPGSVHPMEEARLAMIGETLSHYRLLRKLGGGSTGVVYEAEDLRLLRHVAVKMLPEELAESRKALERFKREARAASSLNHSNICVVHEIGEDRGHTF